MKKGRNNLLPLLVIPTPVKRLSIFALLLFTLVSIGAAAQSSLNAKPDNIVGIYQGVQEGYKFKTRISRLTNGTYRAQVIWMEHDRDEQGHKLLDEKNPNKDLRTTPADCIVLIDGLRYDEKKHYWADAKIYDPLRGIKANVRCWFDEQGKLRVRGSLLGISETVVWTRIKE